MMTVESQAIEETQATAQPGSAAPSPPPTNDAIGAAPTSPVPGSDPSNDGEVGLPSESPIAQAVADGAHDAEIAQAVVRPDPGCRPATPAVRVDATVPSDRDGPDPTLVYRAYHALPEQEHKVIGQATTGGDDRHIAKALTIKVKQAEERRARGLRLIRHAAKLGPDVEDQVILDLIEAGRMAERMRGAGDEPA